METKKREKSERRGSPAGIYFPEPSDHDTVKRAAELEGVSVNEFIITAASKKAERVVEKAGDAPRTCKACGQAVHGNGHAKKARAA